MGIETGKKRPYNSKKRQAQRRETSRQVLAAARELFIQHGYAGTSMEAIGQHAGVATETVYAIFRNKRTLLAEVIALAVGGDDQPIPLLQRPGPQAAMSEPDPARQFHLFARDISTILERVAPLFDVMRMAAKTEPEIAALLQNVLANRRKNLGAFVHEVARHGPLRPQIDEDQATDLVWTLTSPEVFRLLTADLGWPREKYAGWLAETLIRQVLP